MNQVLEKIRKHMQNSFQGMLLYKQTKLLLSKIMYLKLILMLQA